MISEEIFNDVSSIHPPHTRNNLKNQVYYDLNRSMQNAKPNAKFVEVFRALPTVLIEVNKELLEQGYFSMVSEIDGNIVLRLYIRE